MMSLAQGGKFIHGFVSGLSGVITGYIGRIPVGDLTVANVHNFGLAFIAAALGGTASVLSGGSFANGAVSAAFVVLFNDLLHSEYNES